MGCHLWGCMESDTTKATNRFTSHHRSCVVFLLNQGDVIQSCHTPFPILNQSIVPWKVLTVAS